MQLSEIRGLASKKLNEATAATFYSTSELDDWINEAQVEFCVFQVYRAVVTKVQTTALLEKTATVATTGGNWRLYPYTLMADFLWPLRLSFENVPLLKTSHKSLDLWDRDWRSAVGNPEHWGIIGANLMFIHPQPAAPANVDVVYAYVPATLSADGNIPEISVEFHRALSDYAVYKALLKDGQAKLTIAEQYYQRFLSAVGDPLGRRGV